LELLGSPDPEVRRLTAALAAVFESTDPAERKAAIARAGTRAADLSEPVTARLAAVTQLAVSVEPEATSALLSAWSANTPKVREAILEAVFSRRERLPALMDALEKGALPISALTAFQRVTLQEHVQLRERAVALISRTPGTPEAVLARFAAALQNPRDVAHGEQVFRDNCATCHQVRGIGFAVGPDLARNFNERKRPPCEMCLPPTMPSAPVSPRI
jgi:hypothetical protein